MTDNNIEILDIIDEQDNVIGQMPKSQVHEGKQILHREVGVLILDKDNRVLLQQRSSKKQFFPGAWTTSAVGHVPAGKTPEEAAHMELVEELGFDTELTFIERRKYESGDHVSFGYLFKGVFPENAKVVIQEDEVDGYNFFTQDEILKLEIENKIDLHTLKTLKRYYLESKAA